MADQTVFRTHQTGAIIAQELELPARQRETKGDTFTLTLMVEMPFSNNERKPLDITVNRLPVHDDGKSVQTLANDDKLIETTARLALDGEPFKVNILFHMTVASLQQGVAVFVSKDMERIILQEQQSLFDQEVARMLEEESD